MHTSETDSEFHDKGLMTMVHCSTLQVACEQELLEGVFLCFKQLGTRLSAAAISTTLKQHMGQCLASIKYLESLQMGPEVTGPCHTKLKELKEQADANSKVEVQKGMQEAVDTLVQGLRKKYPNLVIGGPTQTA